MLKNKNGLSGKIKYSSLMQELFKLTSKIKKLFKSSWSVKISILGDNNDQSSRGKYINKFLLFTPINSLYASGHEFSTSSSVHYHTRNAHDVYFAFIGIPTPDYSSFICFTSCGLHPLFGSFIICKHIFLIQ